MTTKKVLSTLLILTLCLGLIGCGSKSQDTGADKNTTTTTPVDDKDNTADNTDKTEDAGENTENTGDTNAAEDTGNADASTEDNETAEKIDIEIAALKGPTAIGMIQVMDDAANGTTANNYNFTLAEALPTRFPRRSRAARFRWLPFLAIWHPSSTINHRGQSGWPPSIH